MNRKERTKNKKVNINEFQKYLRENPESIYKILGVTEYLIDIAKENIKQVSVSRKVKEKIEKCTKTMERFIQILPAIREIFLCDKKCKNGFTKKSVVNAFKIPRYKNILKNFVAGVSKNKNNGLLETIDYVIWHDLSAEQKEVEITLDLIEHALPVIINNLKANNIENIKFLINSLTNLERRIFQLYSLYGHYLQDNR